MYFLVNTTTQIPMYHFINYYWAKWVGIWFILSVMKVKHKPPFFFSDNILLLLTRMHLTCSNLIFTIFINQNYLHWETKTFVNRLMVESIALIKIFIIKKFKRFLNTAHFNIHFMFWVLYKQYGKLAVSLNTWNFDQNNMYTTLSKFIKKATAVQTWWFSLLDLSCHFVNQQLQWPLQHSSHLLLLQIPHVFHLTYKTRGPKGHKSLAWDKEQHTDKGGGV